MRILWLCSKEPWILLCESSSLCIALMARKSDAVFVGLPYSSVCSSASMNDIFW